MLPVAAYVCATVSAMERPDKEVYPNPSSVLVSPRRPPRHLPILTSVRFFHSLLVLKRLDNCRLYALFRTPAPERSDKVFMLKYSCYFLVFRSHKFTIHIISV